MKRLLYIAIVVILLTTFGSTPFSGHEIQSYHTETNEKKPIERLYGESDGIYYEFDVWSDTTIGLQITFRYGCMGIALADQMYCYHMDGDMVVLDSLISTIKGCGIDYKIDEKNQTYKYNGYKHEVFAFDKPIYYSHGKFMFANNMMIISPDRVKLDIADDQKNQDAENLITKDIIPEYEYESVYPINRQINITLSKDSILTLIDNMYGTKDSYAIDSIKTSIISQLYIGKLLHSESDHKFDTTTRHTSIKNMEGSIWHIDGLMNYISIDSILFKKSNTGINHDTN